MAEQFKVLVPNFFRNNEVKGVKMKSMKCRDLGGACEQIFRAETFDEIAELCRAHGMKMIENKDSAHLTAMQRMQDLMQEPAHLQAWFESKRDEFEALPED